jgi:cytochrome c oxidase assembly protein subunit 15
MALVTSPGWRRGDNAVDDAMLRIVASTTTAIICLQILVGATMRRADAGLAIADFPLMVGRLIPDHWDPTIATHFGYRVGALITTLAILATAGHVWYHHRRKASLTRPATFLVGLVAIQVALDGLTVLSRRDVWTNSVHLVCGALVLATAVVITLRSWRVRFAIGTALAADGSADQPAAQPLGAGREARA